MKTRIEILVVIFVAFSSAIVLYLFWVSNAGLYSVKSRSSDVKLVRDELPYEGGKSESVDTEDASNGPILGSNNEDVNNILQRLDRFILLSGFDGALTNESQLQLEHDLLLEVRKSPFLRHQIGLRFQQAISAGNGKSVDLLWQVLSNSREGIVEALPTLSDEIIRKGDFASYAVQRISLGYELLDEECRQQVFESVLVRAAYGRDFAEGGEDLNFLNFVASNESNPIDADNRSALLQAMSLRSRIAQSDSEKFLADYHFYKFAELNQATKHAFYKIRDKNNFAAIYAALAGIRDGFIYNDMNLLSEMVVLIRDGEYSIEQLDQLSDLMTGLHGREIRRNAMPWKGRVINRGRP